MIRDGKVLIQAWLDQDMVKQADRVFKDIGLNRNSAMRVFFAKVANVGGIPFELNKESGKESPVQ